LSHKGLKGCWGSRFSQMMTLQKNRADLRNRAFVI